eukprot:Em0005g921a
MNSWDTDIESSSPLSTTDRQSIMLSPNIMPTWSPSASDFQTCAASSSVGNFQTGKTSSSVSDFETSVTSPSASRILVSQKGATVQTLCDRFKEFHRPLRNHAPSQRIKTDPGSKQQKDFKKYFIIRCITPTICFVLLPYMLRDPRVAPDSSMYFIHHWMQYSVQLCGILVEFTKQADEATISGSFHDIIDLAEH